MSSEEEKNKELARRFMEARVKGYMDAVDEMMAPDFFTDGLHLDRRDYRSSGGLTPALPTRRRSGADLLQHAQCVPVGPAFHHLAARDVVGLGSRKRHLVAGRGRPHHLTPQPRWKDCGRQNWGRQAHLPQPDSLG